MYHIRLYANGVGCTFSVCLVKTNMIVQDRCCSNFTVVVDKRNADGILQRLLLFTGLSTEHWNLLKGKRHRVTRAKLRAAYRWRSYTNAVCEPYTIDVLLSLFPDWYMITM